MGNRELLTGIEGHDVRLRAMIDTGSDMSSMDTRDIEVKTHTNGSKWVYFSVPIDDGFGKTVRLVRPLKQFIWVQTHSGKPVKRPVIEATIKLGPITTQTSFSLTEYSAFREKVLLGLNTLAGVTLVDPQAELLLQRCQLHGS
ncbi:putative ATP-dependent zinc protease [Endozoicomonadaceae bacterium StTr2]